MIYALWIMGSDGKNIFFKTYRDESINYDLVRGILTAVKTFSREVSREDISWVTVEDRKFIYRTVKDLYFIFYVKNEGGLREFLDEFEKACMSAESKEELIEKVNGIIEKYNKKKRLEELNDVLRKVEGLP